jgi:hypothetical protein
LAAVRDYRGGVVPLGAQSITLFSVEEDAMYRTFSIGFAVLALAFFVNNHVQADDQTETHEGKVVSVTGQKLIMTMKGEAKEHSHMISKDATITLDGKAATVDDLKPGMRIKVTTPKDDLTSATKIEAFSKDRDN